MTMQLTAKSFSSAADIIAEAAARRRRFEAAGRHPRKKEIEAPKPVVAVSIKRPEWMVYNTRFDAHVIEWRMHMGNPPLAYLKRRCQEIGMPYEVVIGPARNSKAIAVRHLLMWEVWSKYGFSLPKLGRMFGNRDHTTCLYVIHKMAKRFNGEGAWS